MLVTRLKRLFLKSNFIKITSFLSLFGSLSTLVCCALPFILVSLGFGAVFVNFQEVFPFYTIAAKNKGILFILSGFLLFALFLVLYFYNRSSCPVDQKENCEKLKSISWWIFYISLALYLAGFVFSFILPKIL